MISDYNANYSPSTPSRSCLIPDYAIRYNPFCGILCSSLATYTSEHDVRGTIVRTSTSDAVEAVACSSHFATLQMNRETRSPMVERQCNKNYNCASMPICLWASLNLISIFIRFSFDFNVCTIRLTWCDDARNSNSWKKIKHLISICVFTFHFMFHKFIKKMW